MASSIGKIYERDRVISALTADGKFRISAIKNTFTARTAQERHNLPEIPALLLARALSSASLLAVFLKGEERIIIDVVGDGLVSKVSAEAIQVGEVRGFAEFDSKVKSIPKEQFNSVLGSGIFRVIRILYNEPEPIVGIVELIRGDISSDLNYYFSKSEQIFSIVLLDADTDETGKITNSCGMIIQSMPDATEQDNELMLKHLQHIERLTKYIDLKSDLLKELTKLIPQDFQILKNDRVDFFCRCSKEKFIDKLLLMEHSDIQEMQKMGQNELVCRYCNEHYYLSDEDFDRISKIIVAKMN
jgi:molecular chaperone Hsp33